MGFNMNFKTTLLMLLLSSQVMASYILIPMDDSQKNHLKAYGIAFWSLEQNIQISWLLNYRGGSFMLKQHAAIENELVIRGVSYEL